MKKVLLSAFIFVMIIGINQVWAQPYTGAVATDTCETEAGTAVNTPCQNGGHPEIYEAIEYLLSAAGVPSLGLNSNADTDVLQIVGNDGYYQQFEETDAVLIGIGASYTNTLGVYPMGAPGSITYITPPQSGFGYNGSGTVADPFDAGSVSIAGEFGFVLRSEYTNVNQILYSDPSLNVLDGGLDHLMAFSVPQLNGGSVWVDLDNDGIADKQVTFKENAIVLAWEDLPSDHPNFDNDYNDTIYVLTRLTPDQTTPIPEPLTLTLFGAGLAGIGVVRRKKA
ncbi:MAG: PEP-CTERM sorting domain-containing protein [Candidatus Omnitrophica bacterium]|nr:PEP-CTERM sorting domain-containing protein [Candidatus Omnitrophota bacterium]